MTNEEAKEFILKIAYGIGTTAIDYWGIETREKLIEAVNALEEPKEATWVRGKNDKSLLFCNCCGAKVNMYWNYCPNCGAEKNKKIGIIIPDNATNGDMIKLLFPKATYFNEDSSCATMKVNMGELDEYVDFYTDWWNAPYKREEHGIGI